MATFAQLSTNEHSRDRSSGADMGAGEEVSARRSLAWVLAQGANVVAIPGCRSPRHVSDIFDGADGFPTARAPLIGGKID